MNEALFLAILFGKAIQKWFFGELRALEIEVRKIYVHHLKFYTKYPFNYLIRFCYLKILITVILHS